MNPLDLIHFHNIMASINYALHTDQAAFGNTHYNFTEIISSPKFTLDSKAWNVKLGYLTRITPAFCTFLVLTH